MNLNKPKVTNFSNEVNSVPIKNKGRIIDQYILYTIGILLIVYNFHRYFFKYNSSGTSPEPYTESPIIWKISKYIILFFLLLFFYIRKKYILYVDRTIILSLGIVITFIFVNIFNYLFYDKLFFDELEYLIFFILLSPLSMIVRDSLFEITDLCNKFYSFSAWVLIVGNIIVFFNYYFFGVIPALSYEGGLIRFGGLWDDPNGFGFISVFLCFCVLKLRMYIASFLLLICVVLTFSFTSYLLFIVSLFYWMIVKINVIRTDYLVFSLLILCVFLFIFINFYDEITLIYNFKKESLDQHGNLDSINKMSIPLFTNGLIFHETWYISFFFNYFPISIIVICYCFYTIYEMLFLRPKKFINYYIFLFLCGCFFIPFFYVFPLNFIFISFYFLFKRDCTI